MSDPAVRTLAGHLARRDRVLVPAWVLWMLVLVAFSAAATADLYPTQASRTLAAVALNASGAIVALYGRIPADATLGAVATIKLVAFGALVVSAVAVMLVVRHTRAEEEQGRLELLLSCRVRRTTVLLVAVAHTSVFCVAAGLAGAVGGVLGGLAVAGSVTMGAGWTACALLHTGVAAVAAQLTGSARQARAIALCCLAAAYALRAVADLAGPGIGPATWFSAVAWAQQTHPYGGDRWWPLLPPLVGAAALVALAHALAARRDVGAGVRHPREPHAGPGPRTVTALAVVRHRTVATSWFLATAGVGAVLGAVVDQVDGFTSSPEMRQFIEQIGGARGLSESFLGMEIAIVGAAVAAFAVSLTSTLRADETGGLAELLLSTRAGRVGWVLAQLGVTVVGAAAVLGVAGAAAGVGAASALHDPALAATVLVAALAQLPAVAVFASLVVLVHGWWPRGVPLMWPVLVACVVVGEFGEVLGLPGWAMALSPLDHAPRLPVDVHDLPTLGGTLLVAVVLAVVGLVGVRRRDITP